MPEHFGSSPLVSQISHSIICRTCLSTSLDEETFTSVFSTLFFNETQLPIIDLLASCAKITITESDELPHEICDRCIEKAVTCFEFRRQVEESDESLRRPQYLIVEEEHDSNLSIQSGDVETFDDGQKNSIEYFDETVTIPGQSAENKPGMKRDYPCTECNKAFQYESKLREHFRQHINIYPKKCENCSFIAEKPSDWRRHYDKNHQDLKTLPCPKCTKKFFFRKGVLQHLRLYHNERNTQIRVEKMRKEHKCNVCQRSFAYKSKLKEHLESHLNVYPKQCEFCGFIARRPLDLSVHKRELHSDQRMLSCSKCDKKFFTRKDLAGHINAYHENVSNNVCDVCGKRYKYKSSLRVHLRSHSKGDDLHRANHRQAKSHICHICGQTYQSLGNLKIHMWTHTGVKPIKCTMCDTKFVRRYSMLLHIKNVHEHQKRHICKTCCKKFSTRYQLKIHKLIHRRPQLPKLKYACDTCDIEFPGPVQLEKHSISHTLQSGEDVKCAGGTHSTIEGFPCSICGGLLADKSALARHLRTHPTVCNCGMVYFNNSYLQRHIKAHPECAGIKSKVVADCEATSS